MTLHESEMHAEQEAFEDNRKDGRWKESSGETSNAGI